VVFFPISFVCEHLETLYEIDVEYKKLAEELSLRLFRTPLDHTSENLVKAIVSEVKSVMTS
jgi:ferrochelatase